MRISRSMMAAAFAAFLAGAGPALAQVEYKIPGIVDNSGPFADLTKHLIARDAVFKWWNDTEGKKLGITLTVKKRNASCVRAAGGGGASPPGGGDCDRGA